MTAVVSRTVVQTIPAMEVHGRDDMVRRIVHADGADGRFRSSSSNVFDGQ